MKEITIKNSIGAVCLFSVMSILAGCNEEEINSNWALSPPTIDGRMDEWQQASLVIFEDEHAAVGVGNDSTYLYFAARVADAQLRQAIQSSGFTLWLSPDGGTTKDLEIRFPASPNVRVNQSRGGFWKSMTEDQRSRARNRLDEMQNGLIVVDHHSVDSRIFPPDSPDGFGAAIGETNGLSSFEVRVPLHIEKYFPGGAPLDRSGKIGIGIELASVPITERGFNNAPPFGGGQRGSIRGRGRGGGPGRTIPRGGPSQQASEIWLEVALAIP